MNKKRNRKGFTIVELSIVIAVIAILAVVMIPTFTNIISESREAADKQNAKTVYTNYINECIKAEENYLADTVIQVKNAKTGETKYVEIKNGAAAGYTTPAAGTKYLDEDGKAHCFDITKDDTKGACGWCGVKH